MQLLLITIMIRIIRQKKVVLCMEEFGRTQLRLIQKLGIYGRMEQMSRFVSITLSTAGDCSLHHQLHPQVNKKGAQLGLLNLIARKLSLVCYTGFNNPKLIGFYTIACGIFVIIPRSISTHSRKIKFVLAIRTTIYPSFPRSNY